MIKNHCFSKEWINNFRTQELYSKINPPLLEKMIHALSLLQYLKVNGLEFIFKGGTSLILLLDNSNRFSVDIDIITQESRERVEQILDKITDASHFKRWTLDERRSYKEGIPKAHYELEYDSNINKSANYILLDILFEKPSYPAIHQRPVQSIWIETETTIDINLPTIEAITGDKLTAFAPTTTGILYGKGKELEIIKQLFDLGNLFNQLHSVEETARSFAAFARQEIAYRNLSIQPEDILKDSIATCRIISLRERNRYEPEKTRFAELQKGIRSFENYMITGHFRIDEAIAASAKTAYLCSKLLAKDLTPIEWYEDQQVRELEITNQYWNALNRIKRLPDQSAFFYWFKCLETLKQVH